MHMHTHAHTHTHTQDLGSFAFGGKHTHTHTYTHTHAHPHTYTHTPLEYPQPFSTQNCVVYDHFSQLIGLGRYPPSCGSRRPLLAARFRRRRDTLICGLISGGRTARPGRGLSAYPATFRPKQIYQLKKKTRPEKGPKRLVFMALSALLRLEADFSRGALLSAPRCTYLWAALRRTERETFQRPRSRPGCVHRQTHTHTDYIKLSGLSSHP